MADLAISDLTTLTNISDSDLLAVSLDQGGGSYASRGTAFSTLKSQSKYLSVKSKTTTYTLVNTDDVILADASSTAFTLTLPTASGITGKVFFIKKTDSSVNEVTIDGDGSETIDEGTTLVISVQYACVTIVSDGTNWHII
jgi:hypothetical protein